VASPVVRELARKALRLVADAQSVDGRCRNRLSADRRWKDHPGVEDCWGRSLWGLGTAAASGPSYSMREEALARFEHGAQARSPWRHAMAFAGLGAAEVLAVHPAHRAARALLSDAADCAGQSDHDTTWPWPEPRLRYANAALAEVIIAAGVALNRDDLTRTGLERLGWLLDQETSRGHLSVTPVGGRGPDDLRPGFDQQPIEVAALADACARAAVVSRETRWAHGVADAVAWFLGDNDADAVMWDPSTGGGYDGLTRHGPNTNQGAESTLALVSTLQHARNLTLVVA
jgi:hypothetical protein